jgi:preprotein translocase subunit SecG
MNSEVCLVIAGVVVTFCQVAKGAGLPDRWGLVAATVFSLAGVLVYGWSHNELSRATSWNYTIWFANVLASAAGVFGLIRASRDTAISMAANTKVTSLAQEVVAQEKKEIQQAITKMEKP